MLPYPFYKFSNPDIEMRLIVQVIGVHRKLGENVFTSLVMSFFSCFLGASRTCVSIVFSISGFGKLVTLLFIFSLLVACNRSQIRPDDRHSGWNQIKSWSFNGKMAISDGKSSESARITWEVKHNLTKARLKAPFGLNNWTITETPFNAKLKSSQKGESSASDAETLITRELGWEFPWNSLKYWIRGYQTDQILGPHSTLPNTINDNGWIINYQKWMNTPIGLLPKKIKATKDNYSVKLIIYNWDIK